MPINLFSRDTQYDVGNEPSDPGVPLWQSPDIIPRNAHVTDPVAGGLYDDIPTVNDIRLGQDNFVYTRVRAPANATGSAANVRAKLWWSEPGTLAVPSSWTPIGGTVNVTGPGGTTIQANEFPRFAEFSWSASALPALGHHCLVSSVWSDDDPEESVTDVPVFGFSEWVRYKNNVAWRNFNVVAAAPTPPPAPGGSSRNAQSHHFFRIWANTPSGEEDAIMKLALATKLPAGSQVEMEGTQDFLERINPLRLNRKLVTPAHPEIAAAFLAPRPSSPSGVARPAMMMRGVLSNFTRFENSPHALTHRLALQAARITHLTPTKFAANRNEKIAINIWIPKAAMQADVPIVLTQIMNNQVLGGITWRLARPVG